MVVVRRDTLILVVAWKRRGTTAIIVMVLTVPRLDKDTDKVMVSKTIPLSGLIKFEVTFDLYEGVVVVYCLLTFFSLELCVLTCRLFSFLWLLA